MKNITKTLIITALAAFTLSAGSGAYAVEPGSMRNLRQEIRSSISPTVGAIRQEVRTEIKQAQELRKNILDQAKDMIRGLLPRRIHGTIADIAGDSSYLTVTTDNGTVTVYVSSKTLLKRRFGGNSNMSEFRKGDEVAVIGTPHASSSSSSSSSVTDGSIDARYIRDLSIQKRNTVFVGNIVTKGADSFTVQTQSRGVQTVHVSGATTYQEKNSVIGFGDLNVGDRVLVKGSIWDRAASDIDAAKIIKLPTVPATGSTSSASSSSAASNSSASQASSSPVI